ncbi:uncharacterized protein LOC134838928 isoform X3 [Symsagittifera roscoffensis]|uniref:uncharacterized protein LOC134838928 isoform X3 n=1 Tax=Symsagittifera roscoffensis TaxID=84072 RepID=UPI00307C6E6B
MHKDIVNLAEESRSCTRYGENAKYIIPKISSKPLPLLMQPGQELQLDYARPLEDHKDKVHLERSTLAASQLKRRIDQSRDIVKIVRKRQNSRDVSPLFQPNSFAARERERAKELKQLLEANARWNATRRDTSANNLRRIVDENSTKNPELRKELLYPWEKRFIEDKPNRDTGPMSSNFLRKHEQKKSGKALTIPLKGKLIAETPSTVETAAGAVYIKIDIAKSKVSVAPAVKGSDQKRSPTGEEPRSKLQKTAREDEEVESESNDEDANPNQREYRTVLNEDSTAKDFRVVQR